MTIALGVFVIAVAGAVVAAALDRPQRLGPGRPRYGRSESAAYVAAMRPSPRASISDIDSFI